MVVLLLYCVKYGVLLVSCRDSMYESFFCRGKMRRITSGNFDTQSEQYTGNGARWHQAREQHHHGKEPSRRLSHTTSTGTNVQLGLGNLPRTRGYGRSIDGFQLWSRHMQRVVSLRPAWKYMFLQKMRPFASSIVDLNSTHDS